MIKYKKRLSESRQSGLPYAELISRVNGLSYRKDSDEQLQSKVRSLCGSPENENFIPMLAVLKEVVFRLTGLSLFDTQLAAAVSMLNGNVAELPTGEGKTLAAVLTAVVQAMRGRSVHVLVFNDYLAKRDYNFTKPIYVFCGLSVGLVQQSMPPAERKAMYGRNVVYLSGKEAGFDFLRNFLCNQEEDLLCTDFDCAIVDEADSILIDEAKIPLVIAGSAPEQLCSPQKVSQAVKRLAPRDVEVNPSANQAYLTDTGISKTEELLHIRNLYEPENINLLSMVNAALQAEFLLTRDKDYLVKDESIQIIDEFTGRVAENRRYPDILHSAVEAKENLNCSTGSMIYNSVSMQSFLSQYRFLCGMTGTIRTSAKEVFNMYDLSVDVIPPHTPCIRVEHEDVLCDTQQDKFAAAAAEVKRAHAKGQPVLIGTQSVRESEMLSDLLTREEIPHSVLNAKNDEREAELIAKAGEPYRVTVSTNMAGRGVDIRLGGEREEYKEQVRSAGGLYVIGVGINRSIRIDNQLRGRAGRQGDEGASRFFVSLDDPLMVQYEVGDNIARLKEIDEVLITGKQVSKAVRRAQKLAEGSDAETRYMLEKYSYIQEEQRRVITAMRMGTLLKEKPLCLLRDKEPEYYKALVGEAGQNGVDKAEKQLSLYFINLRWAQYLESMEYVRDGIHLTLIGGKNPIDEYHRVAIAAFDEMLDDINRDVLSGMKKYRITADGIDMEAAGLGGATTTWTYLIDERSNQFSRLPYLYKNISNRINGTVFTVRGLAHKARLYLNGQKKNK